MKKNYKNGFFLPEVIVIIAVVSVVLMGVFVVFSSSYNNYKQREKYNTTNAIIVATNLRMYYDSVSELPTYLVTTANPYVELTDMDTYSSTLYTTMKEEFNVRKTYLMNPSYMISTFLSSFNVNIRKYIKSISSINTPILVVELNNNEYGYAKVEKIGGKDCTYDGELVQGATYVEGQYTYKYMQEYTGSSWNNLTTPGWGVALTNRASTTPILSSVCTKINDAYIISTRCLYLNTKASVIDVSTLDTSHVINMRSMFNNTRANIEDIIGFENIKTPNVTDMALMFQNASGGVLDLSKFDMTNVTDTAAMFKDATVTVGYGRTQSDITKLNASSNKPSTLTFTTK